MGRSERLFLVAWLALGGCDRDGGSGMEGTGRKPLFTEVGYAAGQVTFSGVYSRLTATGGTNIGDPGFTFPSNGDEYTRIGAKVYGRISHGLGASAMYFTTLNGRNTGGAAGVSVGLIYSY